jgi:hypothetical protein
MPMDDDSGPGGLQPKLARWVVMVALLGLPAGCSVAGTDARSTADGSTPGWTGRTVVPGSTSTIAGDAAATDLQQKWGVGRGH